MILKFLLLLAALSAQDPSAPVRPRDPFVFRSVLDQRPRMLTIALADDMWVAYDTTTCGLYKAWKGGVKFDGAVYTTVHGPQPTTKGSSYMEAADGPAWDAMVLKNQKLNPIASTTRYAGYRLENGGVVLEWEVTLADGRKIAIDEQPEFGQPETMFNDATIDDLVLHRGDPGLRRIFSAPKLPDDVMVGVAVKTARNSGRLCDRCDREQIQDLTDEQGQYVQFISHVEIFPTHLVSSLVVFFPPKTEPKRSSDKGDKK